MGLFKKAKGLIFGAKDKGEADRYIDLDPSLKRSVEAGRAGQQKGLAGLQSSVEDIGGEIARDERLARQAGQDTSSRIQDLVARRGLQNSSIGMGQEIAAGQRTAQKLAEIRGSMAERKRRGLMSLINASGNVLGNQGAQRSMIQGRKGTGMRSGGLYRAAATAVGGVFGGAEGAKAGDAWGQGVANIGR
jgi:hypothetical protein